MDTIRELEKLLVHGEEPPFLMGLEDSIRIVVLRQFRFHQALCIELYDAPISKDGRIKNSLMPVAESDAALSTRESPALLFTVASSGFRAIPSLRQT